MDISVDVANGSCFLRAASLLSQPACTDRRCDELISRLISSANAVKLKHFGGITVVFILSVFAEQPFKLRAFFHMIKSFSCGLLKSGSVSLAY